MDANKIFFDTYYPHPNENGIVHIVLVDEKIYTSLPRREMLNRGMFHGCMLESVCAETQGEADEKAERLINSIGAREVSPEEFEEIEKKGNTKRVAEAFALAERMIAEG